MKTLVTYYYNETPTTLTNLAFFLKHGLINDPNYYYVFIINGTCSINITTTSNITLTTINISNPLTAYSEYFLSLDPQYLLDFERFYFINSICIGPFLPTYINSTWIESLNNVLSTCDLLAPIVEIPPDNNGYLLIGIDSDLNMPFLHAYMFSTNNSCILLLLNIFKEFTNPKEEYLIKYERFLTSRYLVNGKKISSLLNAFKNININDKNLWSYKLWNKNNTTCYETQGNYFGLDTSPFEIMFVNNSKDNISKGLKEQLINYTVWS